MDFAISPSSRQDEMHCLKSFAGQEKTIYHSCWHLLWKTEDGASPQDSLSPARKTLSTYQVWQETEEQNREDLSSHSFPTALSRHRDREIHNRHFPR